MPLSYQELLKKERQMEKERYENERYREFEEIKSFDSQGVNRNSFVKDIRKNPYFDPSDYE